MSSPDSVNSSSLAGKGTRGPIVWLRLEGLAVLALAVFLYTRGGYSWILFAVLFLGPDVSFIGYLAGPRVGAAGYNVFHSYVIPLVLWGVLSSVGRSPELLFIWIAHIGFDRLLGYGLKYSSGFSDTHLGRIGRKRV